VRKNPVTSIKRQGLRDSSFVLAVVGTIEEVHITNSDKLVLFTLSEQQLLDRTDGYEFNEKKKSSIYLC